MNYDISNVNCDVHGRLQHHFEFQQRLQEVEVNGEVGHRQPRTDSIQLSDCPGLLLQDRDYLLHLRALLRTLRGVLMNNVDVVLLRQLLNHIFSFLHQLTLIVLLTNPFRLMYLVLLKQRMKIDHYT